LHAVVHDAADVLRLVERNGDEDVPPIRLPKHGACVAAQSRGLHATDATTL
jgi:hypothetical protein